ncbi:S-layer homology domain-containing protein [Paenibacillus senegalimassiliensis]|uniref:S-layer homology domain-containing protein n=1 Tax=Paenibacillus senegalimassiliensis TaxID=1737426 RepID=UPI00073F7351|nr:S-layer homology domain-containing protein [Paenibacillus senegalimassiliensis]
MIRKMLMSTLVGAAIVSNSLSTASAALPTYGEEWQNAEVTQSTVSFTDLPSTHWANSYIAEMVNRKVISGYPDGKFRPNNTITRAEFAKIMITASGITPKKVNYSSFSDIESTNWASPFVESVKDYMTGYRTADGKYIFNPSAPATREDVAVALVKLKGYDANRLPDQSTIEAMFKDYAGISESAKSYVALSVENGLVSGFQDETFRPQATITRAEATVMLWRAYQYGNDNKEIGGGQTTTSPTPTPSTSDTSTPTTPVDQPSASTPSAKFTVETLVGGSGAGDVDGPVRTAKINQVDSMVADKNNNVYFLDSQKMKIRKFNSSNGTVETFKTISQDFNWDYKDADGNAKHYDYKNLTPLKLAYNAASNRLYLAAKVSARTIVYDITGGVSVAAYDFYHEEARFVDFIAFPDAEGILYGVTGSHESHVYEGKLNQSQVERIASSTSYAALDLSDYYGYAPVAAAHATADNLYVFGRSKMYSLQLFPVKVDKVAEYENTRLDSATAYNGKLYMSIAGTVYEMGEAGSMTIFINENDLIYKDGMQIRQMKQMGFDNNGNVIFYDDNSKSIRRINL